MRQHFVVFIVHVLTGFTYCYIIEVFFSLLILDPGTICPAFHASLAPGLEVRSGLAAWLHPSLGESWGSVSLHVK